MSGDDQMTPASLTVIARRFAFVRETLGPNRGFWVNKFQRDAGGQDGDSWCADFVSYVLDVAYMGKPPLKRTGSTQTLLAEARAKGYVVDKPAVDCLFFYLNAADLPHHVGIVTGTSTSGTIGIAGNTSEDGQSVNGTGVFEHVISTAHTVYVRLP